MFAWTGAFLPSGMEYNWATDEYSSLLDAVNQTGTVTCLTRRSAGLAMTSSTRRTTTASDGCRASFRPTPTAGMALPTTAPDTTPVTANGGLASNHYRDQGILGYQFMIANTQSGPYSW